MEQPRWRWNNRRADRRPKIDCNNIFKTTHAVSRAPVQLTSNTLNNYNQTAIQKSKDADRVA